MKSVQIVAASAACALAASALATPGYRFPSPFSQCSGTGCISVQFAERPLEPLTYDATITTDREDASVVHLYLTASNEHLGNVTVVYTGNTVASSPDVVIFINGSSSNELSTTPIASVKGIIKRGTATADLIPAITLSRCFVSGNFGGAQGMTRINTLSVGGNLTGALTVNGASAGTTQPLLGETTDGVTITGHLLANVSVSPNSGGFGGSIGRLTVGGDALTPRTITAKSVTTLIGVTGTNSANITITDDVARLSGSVFSGVLKCRDFGRSSTSTSLDLTGAMSGVISAKRHLLAGTTSTTSSLPGVMIANADTFSSGTWGSTVQAGSTSLTSGYTTLSSAFGGGAVGVAPFALHKEDCSPVAAGSLSTEPTNPPTYAIWQFTNPTLATVYSAIYPPLPSVRSRFYGPIKRFTSFGNQHQGAAVQIKNGSSWDIVTSSFVLSGPGVDDAPVTRDLLTSHRDCITYLPGLYRVVRNSDAGSGASSTRLYSAYCENNPEVAQFAHYFRFNVQKNPADLGGVGGVPPFDGVLDNNDYTVFIDYFFLHDPRADLGGVGGIPAQDNAWDNNDFIVFIDHHAGNQSYNPVGTCPGGGGEELPPEEGLRASGIELTGNPAVDRELEALWNVYSTTSDTRVLQLFQDTLFNANSR